MQGHCDSDPIQIKNDRQVINFVYVNAYTVVKKKGDKNGHQNL